MATTNGLQWQPPLLHLSIVMNYVHEIFQSAVLEKSLKVLH